MTKRMLIMVGCVVLLVAVLAFGKYLQIQKLIASSPKPGAQTVTAIKVTTSERQRGDQQDHAANHDEHTLGHETLSCKSSVKGA